MMHLFIILSTYSLSVYPAFCSWKIKEKSPKYRQWRTLHLIPVFRDFLFLNLFLVTNLKNIEFQVIRLVRRPQNGMVCCLGPVLHLPEPFVYIARCFTYGFGKEFRVHEMGAGTGGQIAAVLYQLHASQVYFAVPLTAFLMEFLDFVNAGGSRITTSYLRPSCSSLGRRSKTSAHSN